MKLFTKQEEQILLIIHRLKDKAYLVNIRKKLKEMTGKSLDVGTIYVPMKRLNQRGYLSVSYGEPTAIRGGKAVKYYAITILVLTGFTAGSYPSIFLSSFSPVTVLKSSFKSGSKGTIFRKILVVTQFCLSIFLIIGTWTVYNQQHLSTRRKH